MGELLRRGFDAQLADRNTKGYDLLAGHENGKLERVQVKTVRLQPWYVNRLMFEERPQQVTVFVLLGPEQSTKPARFFVAKNSDIAEFAHYPTDWPKNGFMKLKHLEQYEDNWKALD